MPFSLTTFLKPATNRMKKFYRKEISRFGPQPGNSLLKVLLKRINF